MNVFAPYMMCRKNLYLFANPLCVIVFLDYSNTKNSMFQDQLHLRSKGTKLYGFDVHRKFLLFSNHIYPQTTLLPFFQQISFFRIVISDS